MDEWTGQVVLRCRVDAGKNPGSSAETKVTFDPIFGTVRWDGSYDLNLTQDVREVRIEKDVGEDLSSCARATCRLRGPPLELCITTQKKALYKFVVDKGGSRWSPFFVRRALCFVVLLCFAAVDGVCSVTNLVLLRSC